MPPRRVSLPGADELFRATGGMALSPSLRSAEASAARAETARAAEVARKADQASGTAEVPAARPEPHSGPAEAAQGAARHAGAEEQAADPTRRPRQRGRGARRPTGRERHDEKITVYVSAEELMDLEHARLVLRGEHGLAVDRGRVVREAISVVLADLEQRGEASILVRRLRGR